MFEINRQLKRSLNTTINKLIARLEALNKIGSYDLVGTGLFLIMSFIIRLLCNMFSLLIAFYDVALYFYC